KGEAVRRAGKIRRPPDRVVALAAVFDPTPIGPAKAQWPNKTDQSSENCPCHRRGTRPSWLSINESTTLQLRPSDSKDRQRENIRPQTREATRSSASSVRSNRRVRPSRRLNSSHDQISYAV